MHMTRPKSSKGRTRTSVKPTGSIQDTPIAPTPPVETSRPYRYLHSQSHSHSMIRQTSQDEVVQVLVPAAPVLTLNKYKVLPSIERRQSEFSPVSGIEKKTSKLNLSDYDIHPELSLPAVMGQAATRSNPEMGNILCRVWPEPPTPEPTVTVEIKDDNHSTGLPGSLLLAIRAPCGRRFQQNFFPTDSLLAVISGAEVRFGTRYEEPFIETMDVPRRAFTDLTVTLAQCGILNRSVLCISQENSSVDYA